MRQCQSYENPPTNRQWEIPTIYRFQMWQFEGPLTQPAGGGTDYSHYKQSRTHPLSLLMQMRQMHKKTAWVASLFK